MRSAAHPWRHYVEPSQQCRSRESCEHCIGGKRKRVRKYRLKERSWPNPFEAETGQCSGACETEGQYSLWPAFRELTNGGSTRDALAHVRPAWTGSTCAGPTCARNPSLNGLRIRATDRRARSAFPVSSSGATSFPRSSDSPDITFRIRRCSHAPAAYHCAENVWSAQSWRLRTRSTTSGGFVEIPAPVNRDLFKSAILSALQDADSLLFRFYRYRTRTEPSPKSEVTEVDIPLVDLNGSTNPCGGGRVDAVRQDRCSI